MTRKLLFLVLASVVLLLDAGYAQTPKTSPAVVVPPGARVGRALPGRPPMLIIQGEILDLGCYLTKALAGGAHRECAVKCLAAGIPMGIITADSTVYVLTQFHERAMDPSGFPPPDPFLECKTWPSFYAELTGYIREGKGMKAFEVVTAKMIGKTPPAAQPAK
jgi:hypothetical protein